MMLIRLPFLQSAASEVDRRQDNFERFKSPG
jgi:hypothetical protein